MEEDTGDNPLKEGCCDLSSWEMLPCGHRVLPPPLGPGIQNSGPCLATEKAFQTCPEKENPLAQGTKHGEAIRSKGSFPRLQSSRIYTNIRHSPSTWVRLRAIFLPSQIQVMQKCYLHLESKDYPLLSYFLPPCQSLALLIYPRQGEVSWDTSRTNFKEVAFSGLPTSPASL